MNMLQPNKQTNNQQSKYKAHLHHIRVFLENVYEIKKQGQ